MDAPLRPLLGRTAEALDKAFGMRTVGDLLAHYPRRYAERGELTRLAGLQVDEHVTVLASVAGVQGRTMRHRKGHLLEVTVTDGTGRLSLTFFNQRWRERELQVGRVGLFAGKVGDFRGKRQLAHPDYVLLDDESDAGAAAFAGALIPVYPATAALASWRIATCVDVVLPGLEVGDDPLPEALRRRHRLPGLAAALRGLHRPSSWAELTPAARRLKWDEALGLQVVLAQRRAAADSAAATARPVRADGLLAAFDGRLPFTLTGGQREVGEVIAADLARPHPMHRLLQGEVGAGKTVVALRAMLTVVDNGGQAALLAPTEVLAQQHARSIRAMLGPLGRAGELDGDLHGTRVALLTGSLPAAARRAALLDAASGAAGIVVGTHALLEEKVSFADLGLVVVDEQHRFGVEQREALRAKGVDPPHVLVMTATPIPRTVAMTVFGDLETSLLTELPAGRAPIATYVVPAGNAAWADRMWGRVRDEVAAGHRAYVVCPRIGDAAAEDDADAAGDAPPVEGETRRPAAAVLEVAPALAAGELAGLAVGVLHGRMPPEDKDAAMRAFAAGDLDVLVATTVVEVGVDVPAATVMVLLDADRFGVSQLHQLRGRVGRSSDPGWCLLHTGAAEGSPARERLAAVAASTDGVELARLDLEQRREGDVLGAAQSGRRTQLRLLQLLRDEDIVVGAREEAAALVAQDPTLAGYPGLAAAVAALGVDERADYLERG